MFNEKLIEAINLLTCELRELRLERQRQCATKADISEAKLEILKAIRTDGITPGIEIAVCRLQAALNRLDAQIDDQ